MIINVELTEEQAYGLSQLVKRLLRNDLGESGLHLITHDEAEAEDALIKLRDELAAKGRHPR
jgi:hypothetical protein